MGGVIDWYRGAPEPDLEGMDREELLALLETVRERIRQLDLEEPEDMASEAYDAWGDRHEALEDLADDIQDRLDELREASDTQKSP